MSLYVSVVQYFIDEISKVQKANALSATVIMIYVAIDAMAFLSMPLGKLKNDSKDFINWVDTYMKADDTQAYQYNGKDMWGARCAKLHSYSSYSEYSENNKCKLYGYWNGEDHKYDPSICNNLIIISIPRLVRDFGKAIQKFIKDISNNTELKKRTDSRIDKISLQFRINPDNID